MVAVSVQVALWKAEHLKGGNCERQVCLQITLNFRVVDLVLKEIFCWLPDLEVF
jgi:hypothetical protein